MMFPRALRSYFFHRFKPVYWEVTVKYKTHTKKIILHEINYQFPCLTKYFKSNFNNSFWLWASVPLLFHRIEHQYSFACLTFLEKGVFLLLLLFWFFVFSVAVSGHVLILSLSVWLPLKASFPSFAVETVTRILSQ